MGSFPRPALGALGQCRTQPPPYHLEAGWSLELANAGQQADEGWLGPDWCSAVAALGAAQFSPLPWGRASSKRTGIRATCDTIESPYVTNLEFIMVTVTHPERRAEILRALRRANSKYDKPFTSGRMATFSVMGGNWEEYAEVVTTMVVAETLLAIEALLTKLVGPLPDENSGSRPL